MFFIARICCGNNTEQKIKAQKFEANARTLFHQYWLPQSAYILHLLVIWPKFRVKVIGGSRNSDFDLLSVQNCCHGSWKMVKESLILRLNQCRERFFPQFFAQHLWIRVITRGTQEKANLKANDVKKLEKTEKTINFGLSLLEMETFWCILDIPSINFVHFLCKKSREKAIKEVQPTK